MGIIMCDRCDKMIDLDHESDEVITVEGEEMHWTCATDEEQERHEKEE